MSSKDAWHILEISTFLTAVHFFPSLAYVIKIFLSLFSSILKTRHTQKALPSIRQEAFDEWETLCEDENRWNTLVQVCSCDSERMSDVSEVLYTVSMIGFPGQIAHGI